MERGNVLTSFGAAVAVGALAALLGPASGHAANLKVAPSIALEETWDTNIFNVASDEQSDFISRGTPGLAFSYETERTVFRLNGSVTGERYADHRELNTWNATKRAELSAPTLTITPRLTMKAAAIFVETNDLSNRNELVLSPIQGLPPTETLVVGRTATRNYGGSLQATYQVTPNSDLGIGGGGTKIDYLSTSPGLIDSRTVTGNVSARHRISPRTTSGLIGSTGYTAYDDRSNSRSYSGGLTGSFAVKSNTTVDAGVGITFLTDSSANGAVNREQSPYGRLAVKYSDRDFSAGLAASYELTGGGSFGQATDRANASVTLADQLTAKWSLDLSGYYQNEKTSGPQTSQTVETAGGTAGVRYAPAQWASLRLAASTFKQWAQGGVGSDFARSQAFFGFTLNNTYNLF